MSRTPHLYLITCPYDNRGFDTLTEFWRHCCRAHSGVLDREETDLTVEALTRALARRVARDAETAQVSERLSA